MLTEAPRGGDVVLAVFSLWVLNVIIQVGLSIVGKARLHRVVSASNGVRFFLLIEIAGAIKGAMIGAAPLCNKCSVSL